MSHVFDYTIGLAIVCFHLVRISFARESGDSNW